jgi:hypothetical protein
MKCKVERMNMHGRKNDLVRGIYVVEAKKCAMVVVKVTVMLGE